MRGFKDQLRGVHIRDGKIRKRSEIELLAVGVLAVIGVVIALKKVTNFLPESIKKSIFGEIENG